MAFIRLSCCDTESYLRQIAEAPPESVVILYPFQFFISPKQEPHPDPPLKGREVYILLILKERFGGLEKKFYFCKRNKKYYMTAERKNHIITAISKKAKALSPEGSEIILFGSQAMLITAQTGMCLSFLTKTEYCLPTMTNTLIRFGSSDGILVSASTRYYIQRMIGRKKPFPHSMKT